MPRMGGYVPTDHKTRHQDGGRDEISIASLSGEPATLTTHKDLETGVHGVGSGYIAQADQADLVASKVVWKTARTLALNQANKTASIDWTDLDLTSATSAKAKFAIVLAQIHIDSYTSGALEFMLRVNGSTDSFQFYMTATDAPEAGDMANLVGIIGLDSGQVCEYSAAISGTAQADFNVYVLGYIE